MISRRSFTFTFTIIRERIRRRLARLRRGRLVERKLVLE